MKSSSLWSRDFFALMIVWPLVFSAANITALLHWAEPFVSWYFIGVGVLVPFIVIGSLPELELNFAPNFSKGSVILKKSLFDKLLSPLIVIFFFRMN